MKIIRTLIVLVVMGGTIWLLWNTLYKGLSTGKIDYGDSSKICDRKTNPARYWYLVALFSSFLMLICAVVVTVFVEMWVFNQG
jgi:hypothetical protein